MILGAWILLGILMYLISPGIGNYPQFQIKYQLSQVTEVGLLNAIEVPFDCMLAFLFIHDLKSQMNPRYCLEVPLSKLSVTLCPLLKLPICHPSPQFKP